MALKGLSLALVIAFAATGLVVTAAAAGVLSSYQTVPAGGTVTALQSVNVGIYADSACTQNASFVDWGALKPGDSTTKIVWVKNAGNANAALSMSTNNWTPANAYSAMSLTWNQEGKQLAPNEVVQATLTLSISASIDASITSFGFNIQITGTG